jgi:integrase
METTMATRSSKLENATARRRLAVRKKPYFATVAPGIALGYRRNQGAGTWSVRSTDGHGTDWIKRIALADDQEPADGTHVLNFWQAQDRARALARGKAGADDGRPLTVAEALERYEADLQSRGGDIYNARRARAHLTGALASKPVALLGATELRKWRDALTAKGLAAATVNRTRTCLRAALELAAAHDHRITNTRAWRVSLAGLPDSHRARNVILDDATVRRLVEAAYAADRQLGLLVEVAAVTGARLSQLARLEAGDLQADRPDPRVMMPCSRKGRGQRKIERRPVPIPASLAAMLAQQAKDRPLDAPLLTRAGGSAWGHSHRARHRDIFRAVVAAAELDPDEVTLYALRHSSIVRQLIANVPIRVVAALHDTSVGMIERTYSKHIAEHSDALARRGMLDLAQPVAGSVVSLPQRGRR